PGGAMSAGDLAQALSMLTVLNDCGPVEIKGSASDVAAFEASAPHAGAHSLDDQVAFQFGDGADDDHDSPAQRTTGVDVLPERDVFDLQPAEFVQYFEEVFYRPGDPV